MKKDQLGEIVRLAYGKALKQDQRHGGDVPVIGSSGIVGSHNLGITVGPTIVVGRKGSIGTVTWVDGPAWPIDTAYFVEPLHTPTSSRWIYWMLRSLHLEDMNKSAAVPGLNRDDVYRLQVPLPPFDEQRRIAAILDKADAIRQKRLQAIAHLDTLAQSIFYASFGNPLTNNRRLQTAPIGSLAEVVTGSSPSRANPANFGSKIEWLKSDNLGLETATIAEEMLSELGKSKARIAPSGSVLVTCIAGSARSIGKSAIVNRDVSFNQQINAVLPSQDIDSTFLLWQLKIAPELVRAKSTGGMKGLVNKSAFKSVEILLPSPPEQLEFRASIERIRNNRSGQNDAHQSQDRLFASLQSRAFRGEL